MQTITPTQLAQWLKTPHPPRLLDVREPGEFAFVSLPTARLIPLGEVSVRADELNDWQDSDVVVYCHHGVRSARAVHLLSLAGFQKIYNLSGGINRWSLEVNPHLPRY